MTLWFVFALMTAAAVFAVLLPLGMTGGAPSGGEEIEFEALPREGFVITRTRLPRVTLECRPGYETHVLYCNRTRTEDHESAPQEFVFTLSMTVDESDAIVLGDQTRAFLNLGEVIEYLLKPVFFPTLDQGA